MATAKPSRGEVWLVDLNPTKGREQRGRRPYLVVSADPLNYGPAELAIVLPITSKEKGIPSHVPAGLGEGGLRVRSFIKCEDIRSVSTAARFVERWGAVRGETMREVERRLRFLLEL